MVSSLSDRSEAVVQTLLATSYTQSAAVGRDVESYVSTEIITRKLLPQRPCPPTFLRSVRREGRAPQFCQLLGCGSGKEVAGSGLRNPARSSIAIDPPLPPPALIASQPENRSRCRSDGFSSSGQSELIPSRFLHNQLFVTLRTTLQGKKKSRIPTKGLQWRTIRWLEQTHFACTARYLTYAQEDSLRRDAEKAGTGGRQGNEECACSVLELPRGSSHLADQRQNLFRMQCRERFLWNDQLCGADGDIFRGRAVGLDRNSGCSRRQRSRSRVFAVWRMPPGDL